MMITLGACKKEGYNGWILREHLYTIEQMPLYDEQGNEIIDFRRTAFGFAKTMTFKISGLFSGKGEIGIVNEHSEDVLYDYGWTYDTYNDCWYYDYGQYRITITETSKNTYSFNWYMVGLEKIHIDFLRYGSKPGGGNHPQLWKDLEQDYKVFMDETRNHDPATMKSGALQGDNRIHIVLKF